MSESNDAASLAGADERQVYQCGCECSSCWDGQEERPAPHAPTCDCDERWDTCGCPEEQITNPCWDCGKRISQRTVRCEDCRSSASKAGEQRG